MINRKIEYFITLAECLSFSKTALKYSVSQTAISQFIALLEGRLGVKLFERSQHSVAITAAGESYYRYAKEVLRRDAQEMENLKVISSGYQGSLKVGVGLYEYCRTEGFFSRFLTLHPEIRVDILQYPYSTLIEKLRTQELDIVISDALCEEAFAACELMSRTLFESPNYLVASDETASRYADAVSMLQSECLITNCEAGGPSSLQMLRNLLMDQFGFVPERISQTNSVNAQIMMVRAGRGVALVPGFVAGRQAPGLVHFDLPEKKNILYKLLCLSDHNNPAVDTMFSFTDFDPIIE